MSRRLQNAAKHHQPNRFHNPYFKSKQQGSDETHWWQHGDRWAYGLSFVLLVGMLLYFGITQRWLWIDYIKVTGNNYLTVNQIAAPVRNSLNQKRWLVIPQRFYPFTKVSAIQQEIQANLANNFALSSLTVHKQFPNTISVTVQERIPGVVYIVNNQFFYLDKTGTVTRVVDQTQLDPQFPHIRDINTNRTIKIGDAAIQPSVMNFILQLSDNFTADTHLDVSEYQLPMVACQAKQFVEQQNTPNVTNANDAAAYGINVNAVPANTNQAQVDILNQIQNKQITAEQGLTLLNQLQTNSNNNTNNANSNVNINQPPTKFSSQYQHIDCNYPAVLQQVNIVTQQGPIIYFDSNIDLTTALNHLDNVVKTTLQNNVKAIKYIDVRYPDKVYYQ